jgi:Family of unknown function (DUF5320)
MRYGRGNCWTGQYPGRGPYNNIPPGQRPGWLYGRGACWQLYGPYNQITPIKPEDEITLLNQQKELIENQLKTTEETLQKIQQRLEELKKQ